MAAESSSPKRPTKKAGSQTRSITSSTIGKRAKREERPAVIANEVTSDSSEVTETSTEAILLTKSEQRELLQFIQAGASPLAACNKLGVLLESYDLTRERDARFRLRLQRLHVALDENVDAAIYRDAIKGSASAQSNWKKQQIDSPGGEAEQTAREKELAELSTEDLLAYQRRLRTLGGNDSSAEES